jgi:guanylate kinase
MHPLIIISGPAGVGKTTVAKALFKIYPSLRSSVTYTTRKPRTLSTEDKKMYYVTPEEFTQKQAANGFLEWAKVHGDFYGTAKDETVEILKTNPVLFNIDVQGAEQLMNTFPGSCLTIFLVPESQEQMVDHIKNRGEMTEGAFQTRLKSAEFELSKRDLFQNQIVNKEGKLSETIEKIAQIIEPAMKSA